MIATTDDLRINEIVPLTSPRQLLQALPLSEEAREFIQADRQKVERIIQGQDDRLLVILGPCSIHDPKAALEFARHIKEAAAQFEEDLVLVMRVYFEKPRTTVGWKGLINDPALDGTYAINDGLRLARELLIDLLRMGVPAATEFLDTISPQYMADTIVWGAIGARTTESQVHRELASGLSMPVGFKNGTDGNVRIAIDAIQAAANPHAFLSVTKEGTAAIVRTQGNGKCHLILRGSSNGPNYAAEHVEATLSELAKNALVPAIMIDCSHGNSNKDHRNQSKVAASVAEQMAEGQGGIMGVMIESHLIAGRQDLLDPKAIVYGQSITDACVDWDTAETMLKGFAQAVQARRKILK